MSPRECFPNWRIYSNTKYFFSILTTPYQKRYDIPKKAMNGEKQSGRARGDTPWARGGGSAESFGGTYRQASTHTRIKAGVAAPSASFPRRHRSHGARLASVTHGGAVTSSQSREKTHARTSERKEGRRKSCLTCSENLTPRQAEKIKRKGRENGQGEIPGFAGALSPRLFSFGTCQNRRIAPRVPQQQVSQLNRLSASSVRTHWPFFASFLSLLFLCELCFVSLFVSLSLRSFTTNKFRWRTPLHDRRRSCFSHIT